MDFGKLWWALVSCGGLWWAFGGLGGLLVGFCWLLVSFWWAFGGLWWAQNVQKILLRLRRKMFKIFFGAFGAKSSKFSSAPSAQRIQKILWRLRRKIFKIFSGAFGAKCYVLSPRLKITPSGEPQKVFFLNRCF